MIVQTLTVITGDDQQRAVPGRVGLETLHQPSELRVGIGQLAVVRPVTVVMRVRKRRHVGPMGIVDVEPGEQPLAWPAVEPVQQMIHTIPGVPRGGLRVLRVTRLGLRRLHTGVESLVQAEPLGDDLHRRKSGRGKAGTLQRLGEGVRRRAQLEEDVVANAVVLGVDAGEHRRVRRQRGRDR